MSEQAVILLFCGRSRRRSRSRSPSNTRHHHRRRRRSSRSSRSRSSSPRDEGASRQRRRSERVRGGSAREVTGGALVREATHGNVSHTGMPPTEDLLQCHVSGIEYR